jgi:hypothetical protein
VRVVGVLLLLAAVAGGLAWYSILSPFTLQRHSVLETTLVVPFTETGTYNVFEEGPDAAQRTGPALVSIDVRSVTGRKIDTTSLIGADGQSSVTYSTPWQQGRGVSQFTIDTPGTYYLITDMTPAGRRAFAGSGQASRAFDDTGLPKVVIAPLGSPSPLGNMAGLALLVLVPALIGGGLLLVAAQRWPSPLRRSRRSGRRAAGQSAAPVGAGTRPAVAGPPAA